MFSLRIVLVCVYAHLINGSLVDDLSRIKRGFPRQVDDVYESSRTPSNIKIRAGEHILAIHWTPPRDINDADFCVIEYKDSPLWTAPREPLLITIPFAKNKEKLIISGLRTDTRLRLRLYCFYGNIKGPPSDWLYASTRTAVFEKCPASIPNGKLQKHCGPALDWLCEFECNPEYQQHPFMGARLKGFNNEPAKLLCGDDGIWKTGYEDIGLDISGLCFPRGLDRNCTTDIQHASVYTPCPSGSVCSTTCDDGYRLRALAGDEWLACVSGEWTLRSTKYDQSITPQTVCVPEASQSSCPRNIPNGHIPDGCTANCEPVCNEGYIGKQRASTSPDTVTCENGQWLTKSESYTGENICFPEGGMLCPPKIPNGEFSDYPERLKDYGRNREYRRYRCREGYRYNRGVPFIECVAGNWTTWNERFGIDTNDLCLPINQ